MPRPRTSLLGGVVAILAAVCAAPSTAQTVFEPGIWLGGGYVNHADYAEGDSDSYYRTALWLPVTRQTARGSLSLALRGSYQLYSENSDLDQWNYNLGLGWSYQASPRGTLRINATARRQDSIRTLPLDQTLETLRPRYRDDTLGAGISYGYDLRPRWNLGFSLQYRDSDYEELLPPPGELPVADSRETTAGSVRLGWRRSERDTLGLRYGYRIYSSAEQADRDAHQVGAYWSREVAERTSIHVGIGAFSVEKSSSEDFERKEGPYGTLSVVRQLESMSLTLSAAHRLDNQDPFASDVGQVSTVTFSLGQPMGRIPVQWGASVGYGWREDSVFEGDSATLETARAGVKLGVPLGQKLGLSITGRWTKRLEPDDFEPAYSVRAGIVWFPFGSVRLGSLGDFRPDPIDPAGDLW